jgi:hypothetical protein
MTFFQRNARFIVPLPWLILAAMKLWQAVHVGGVVNYAGGLGFAVLAGLIYLNQRMLYLKRLQDRGPA